MYHKEQVVRQLIDLNIDLVRENLSYEDSVEVLAHVGINLLIVSLNELAFEVRDKYIDIIETALKEKTRERTGSLQ